MKCSEGMILNLTEILEPLIDECVEIQRRLKEEKNHLWRQRLKAELDEVKIDAGQTLIDCGRHEEALVIYSSLSWKENGEVKCEGICQALIHLGRHDEAARLVEAGLRRYPDSQMLWVTRGALFGSLGDHCESIRCFDRAMLCPPAGRWEPLYNKAISLEKLGSYGEAVQIIEELIKKHPRDPRFLSERGYCAFEMGYPQEALQYYASAMKFWPDDPDVYIGVNIYAGLCVAHLALGEKKEAVEIALKGLKKFPDEDPILYQNVGAAFWEMGWKEETREVLKKGIEKFPEDEELKKTFQDVDDDMNDPDNGINPPILALILLTAILHKRLRRR